MPPRTAARRCAGPRERSRVALDAAPFMAAARKRRERPPDETRDVSVSPLTADADAARAGCVSARVARAKRPRGAGWRSLPASSWPAVDLPSDADNDARGGRGCGGGGGSRKRRHAGGEGEAAAGDGRLAKVGRGAEATRDVSGRDVSGHGGGGGGNGVGGGGGLFVAMDEGCTARPGPGPRVGEEAAVSYVPVRGALASGIPGGISRLPVWTAWAPTAPSVSIVPSGVAAGGRGGNPWRAAGSRDGAAAGEAAERGPPPRRGVAAAASHVVIEELPDDFDTSAFAAPPQYMDVDC